MIDLYYYTSPNARKVLIALEELGLQYRVNWTDITAGDQFTPGYLAINPNSRVPAIVDPDGPGHEPIALFESAAILQYLAEKTGRLLSADPRKRYETLCWLTWQVANQGPMAGQAAHFVSHARNHGIEDEYATTRYVTEVARLYQVLEDRLADREYLVDAFSIADIACFPWVRVARGHGIDLADYPRLAEWSEQISARPSAKVRVDDPREERARRNDYSAEQFQTLFRPDDAARGEGERMTSIATEPISAPLLTIGGSRRDARDRISVINPATGEQFAEVPCAGVAELDEAVTAAEAASTGWAALDPDERSGQVLAFAAAVREHLEELARLLTLEQGKPLSRARGEISSGLKWVEWAAANPLVTQVREDGGERIEIRRVPVGVVGAITAWNYPQMLALMKLGPALVTGNTVIVKPSPFTPLSTLRLGEIAQQVLPAGVVQVLAGGDDLGRALTTHPGIHKISFTGSVATGKAIMAASAATLKRVTLELGGNDAGIVLDDVDPATVAADLYAAGLSNAGQVCSGLKRLYVPEARVTEYAEALADVAAKVVVGNGLDDGVDMGPVQNAQQLAKVKALVDSSIEQGATVTFRGEAPSGAGYWHPVTLVRAERDDVPVVAEEQFGPVLPILGYDSVDEAVGRANGTPYGLGASVWSPDDEKATAVARRLQAGSVWNNTHPNLSPDVPFGGLKDSGVGVESGLEGLLAYTDASVLRIRR